MKDLYCDRCKTVRNVSVVRNDRNYFAICTHCSTTFGGTCESEQAAFTHWVKCDQAKAEKTFADLVKVSQEHRLAEQQFEEAYRTREGLAVARRRALAEYAADLQLNANDVFIFNYAGKFFTLRCNGGSDWTLSPVEPIVIS